MEINLNLTDKEAGYLAAAVLDFLHKMNRASEEEFKVVDLDERVRVATSLWKKIEKVTEIL